MARELAAVEAALTGERAEAEALERGLAAADRERAAAAGAERDLADQIARLERERLALGRRPRPPPRSAAPPSRATGSAPPPTAPPPPNGSRPSTPSGRRP